MNYKTRVFPAALASLLLASTAAACLWDSDTLQMERLRFPGVLEIITGKFVRHSKAYYEWRIPDRRKKLEAQSDDPALIDDLAVAYDKLGRPEEGIVLLEKSLARQPDRYETLANLATLLFHAGKLEESKQYVERALEINPNAHFGREKYQLLLTEYVLQSELKTAGVMNSEQRQTGYGAHGFAKFVLEAQLGPGNPSAPEAYSPEWHQRHPDEIRDAIKGVLGMMHFADFESPVLLEALGDLLIHGWPDDMTQLAARAYLRASQLTKNKSASEKYREMAQTVLMLHDDYGTYASSDEFMPKLDRQLAEEISEGKAWFAEIENREKLWIEAKTDVDREFAAVYYTTLDETLSDAQRQVESEWYVYRPNLFTRALIFAFGLLCVAPTAILGGGVLFYRYLKARRRAAIKVVSL